MTNPTPAPPERALSVKWPWSGALVAGVKDIENRSWRPPDDLLGKRLAIQQSQKPDKDAVRAFATDPDWRDLWVPDDRLDHPGHIVGSVVLYGWVEGDQWNLADHLLTLPDLDRDTWRLKPRHSPWFVGPVAWLVGDAVMYEPAEHRGALSCWTINDDVRDALELRVLEERGLPPEALELNAAVMRKRFGRKRGTWRDWLGPMIEWLLMQSREHGWSDDVEAEVLRRCYPLSPPWKGGPSWQYRVWRDELKRQKGIKPPLGTGQGGSRKQGSDRCKFTIDLVDLINSDQ